VQYFGQNVQYFVGAEGVAYGVLTLRSAQCHWLDSIRSAAIFSQITDVLDVGQSMSDTLC
jgi:hypothetical protein